MARRKTKQDYINEYNKLRNAAYNYKFPGLHGERFHVDIPEIDANWNIGKIKTEIEKIRPERITSYNNPSPYVYYQQELSFRGRGGKTVIRKTDPITVPELRNIQELITKVNKVRKREGVELIGKPVMYNGQEVITEPFTGLVSYKELVSAIERMGKVENINKKKKQFVDNFRDSLTTSLQFIGFVDLDDRDEFIQYYLVNQLREYVSKTNWKYIYSELYKARNTNIKFSEIFGSDQIILGSVDNIKELYSIFKKYNAPSYETSVNELGELYDLIQAGDTNSDRYKHLAGVYTKYNIRPNQAKAVNSYQKRVGKTR